MWRKGVDVTSQRMRFVLVVLTASFALGGCTLLPHSMQPPHAVIRTSCDSGRAPLDVSFDGSGSTDDGTIATYEWDFGDGTAKASGPQCTHTFRTPGTRDVVLTVVDNNGVAGTAEAGIVVQNCPPVANFRLSDDAPIPNETVTVDASASFDPDGSELSFAWDFGDGTEGQGAKTTHAYSSVGTYTIVLTVSDASNAQSVLRHNVLVHPWTHGGGCSGSGPIVL